ncbi:hypothetical protein ACH4F6_38160 [Streptomyces sp. NPDC017936]|uniref:hypothetical protein n=1 Tax=Streptomyces sp. NPDC017936 TaxID=3365016 RepID=UPI0037A2A383
MTTAPQTDPFSADSAKAAQFLGGGTVAAKFPKPGFTVEGTIIAWRMAPQTDMESGELLFWEGRDKVEQSKLRNPATAKPVEQLVIELQGEPTGITWETNRYVEKPLPDDDGVRTLYVKGSLQFAVGKAMREAGKPNQAPEIGAYLKVQRGQDTKRPGSKYFSYSYVAQYTPAEQNTKAAGNFLAQGEGGGQAVDPFGGN